MILIWELEGQILEANDAPLLEEAQEALVDIIKDGKRRGDVIGRRGPLGTYPRARPFFSRCLRTQTYRTGRLIDPQTLSVAWHYPGGHHERGHEPC
jgi:hypothetical protein